MCSGAERKRVFYAIEPDVTVRRHITNTQRGLDLPGKAVPAVNFHITLAFLGPVAIHRISELLAIGSKLAPPRCELALDRCGCFPRSGVAWLGSHEPPAELVLFQAELAARLRDAGYAVDSRPWVPHVTLYRKLRKPCAKMMIDMVRWRIDGYCLMHSRQCLDGVVYKSLDRWAAAS